MASPGDDEFGCEHQNHNPCRQCINEIIAPMANLGFFGHLVASVWCLLNFEFYGILVEFVWAFQRILRMGDYAEGGWFDELGIDWRKSSDLF